MRLDGPHAPAGAHRTGKCEDILAAARADIHDRIARRGFVHMEPIILRVAEILAGLPRPAFPIRLGLAGS